VVINAEKIQVTGKKIWW